MPEHRRYYGALKTAYQQVAEDLAQPAPEPAAMSSRPAPPEAEFVNEEDVIAAHRAAYAEALQEKVDSGRISGSEKAYRLAHFDQGEYVATRQAEALREARALAAAARAHEAAEQARELERGGPER